GNEYVHKVLFVGLLPLGQASFLSGLNNVGHYPMHILPGTHGHAYFSDMFGFTEKEVEFLLSKSDRKSELDNLCTHYNRYRTSTNERIYNPHSVISSLQKVIVGDYWINSGQAFTIKECLKKCSQDIEDQLQSLYYAFYSLQDDDSLQNQPDINTIYTLLCYSGYLIVKFDNEFKTKLVIPNKEVAKQWKEWIIDFLGVDQLKVNEIFNSLFKKDIKTVCEQFLALYIEMVSYHDIGDSKRARSYESQYHNFILGALSMYHGDDYQVLSNRESGNGHFDICINLVNQKFDTCIIFEFKLAESEDRDKMKTSTKNGLDQIADRNYRSNTKNYIETIVEVAIAFCKKSSFVSAQLLRCKKDEKK
ncbi:9882_t:CDS:2, partial [Racocetra persica]